MKPNIEQAKVFLERIAGSSLVTFQTFDDSLAKKGQLAKIIHGATENVFQQLAVLNEQGAGVFFMVNEGDGNGRKAENVIAIRAVCADFDGEPLPDTWSLSPHIIVESSTGKFHAYWPVSDCPLEKFTPVQKAIAAKFSSDPSVNDLPRVLRVPGFKHQKGEPFLSRVVSMNDAPPYTIQQVIDGLELNLSPKAVLVAKAGSTGQLDYFKGSDEGSRTAGVVRISRSLARRGFTEDEVVLFCLTHDTMHNKPPLETTHPGKVEYTVRDVFKRYVYTEPDDFVTELNRTYFVTSEGGKTVVCREEYNDILQRNELHYMTFSDFRNLYSNIIVAIGTDKDGFEIYGPKGAAWLKSALRRQYRRIVMSPSGDVPDCYNRWRGFSVEPAKGSWRRMAIHIRKVLCDGDDKLFQYLIKWLARLVQHPELPGEVAIVLQGGRGAGKGVFVNALCHIFGQHSCHITNGKHITGNFNSHLEDCILIFFDEAFWAGDRAGESVLKGLITEPTIPIERKFMDLKQIPNMLHVMMASNNDWIVPAGLDERRYCVLKVSDAEIGNHQYFSELVEELENGGYEAMLHDLLAVDISGFNVRAFPKTEGLLEQKLLTMEPFQAWWYQKLQEGEIVAGYDWDCVPSEMAHDNYCETTSKMSTQIRRLNSTGFGIAIKKVMPEGWPKKTRVKADFMAGKRAVHYLFPSIEKCRKHFDALIGEKMEWLPMSPLTDNVIPLVEDPEA